MSEGEADSYQLDCCFDCNSGELRRLLAASYNVRARNFQDVVHFYFPGMVRFESSFHRTVNPYRFPAVSVTGMACQLNCGHCRGKLLKSMIPAETPDQLYRVAVRVRDEGGSGILISGGSLSDGRVPLKKFFGVIGRIKEELGLSVVVHTGLVDEETAEGLASAGVDCAMMDIVGSNETIREILHLNRGVEDYDRSLELLEEYGVPSVPHIVVGLHGGKLRGEREALRIICKRSVAALVLVVLTPTESPSKFSLPPLSDVLRVVVAARLSKPRTPLLLGCARPRGNYKVALEVLSIKAGVNGVAYPSDVAFQAAAKRGLQVKIHDECCSLAWKEVAN